MRYSGRGKYSREKKIQVRGESEKCQSGGVTALDGSVRCKAGYSGSTDQMIKP